MENYIPISFLNDFLFCPRSIYFHRLYEDYDSLTYNQKSQIAGIATHRSIENQTYSKRSDILVDYNIYVEKYKLYGKIDIFNVKTGILTERKRKIKNIYDGYVLQVYAHYFGLMELGYNVKIIQLYDYTANKNYSISLPEDNPKMFHKFEQLIEDINNFEMVNQEFETNSEKCKNCIYSNLCDMVE